MTLVAALPPVVQAVPAPAPASIVARGLCVDYGTGAARVRVLSGIDLTIPKGSISAFIGPSGCGKSTLLKVLAGLLPPSAGTVTVAGLTPQDAARRHMIGLVFQDATLLPWTSALHNAAFLLQVADKEMARSETLDRAREMLRLVGLDRAIDRRPDQLSGGMRQRVAIARALALDPAILMLDEPFGALDAITREEMGALLLGVWEGTGKTVVLVTHSIDEAVFLSGEVHVMATDPARITETLPIPLPYPRDDAAYESPAFHQAEARLRRMLKEGHRR